MYRDDITISIHQVKKVTLYLFSPSVCGIGIDITCILSRMVAELGDGGGNERHFTGGAQTSMVASRLQTLQWKEIERGCRVHTRLCPGRSQVKFRMTNLAARLGGR